MSELRLELGELVLSFVDATGQLRMGPGERYAPFVSEAPADVAVQVRCEPLPALTLGTPVFESGGNWSLYSAKGKCVIRIKALGFDPYQVLVLDPDFRHGDLYCSEAAWQKYDPQPVSYPIEEALVILLLAQGRGILLHASGVINNGWGLLFNGVSGAGKSTMATLWEGREDVTVLSDDRVIVRERGGQFWAYGTPWHGDARILSPEAAPLEQLFVLHHAESNEVSSLASAIAVSQLLARSFPPFWDAEGMAFTLAFLERLVEAVPCYALGFVPDESTVEFVRCVR